VNPTACPRPDLDILCCDCRGEIRDWEFRDVMAPYWRLYWNGCAGAVLMAGGRETRMTPATLVLIPGGTRFSTRSETPFSHLFVHFRAGSPFSRVIPRLYAFPVTVALEDKLRRLYALLAESAGDSRRIDLLAYSLVFDSLLLLAPDDFARDQRCDPRVERAMDILDKDTSRLTCNAELAEAVGMTPNAFVRLFTGQAGVSPQKYSRQRRVEKAALLLHFSDRKIEAIAQETGFLDRYHFTRVFTHLMSRSPAEFRKHRE